MALVVVLAWVGFLRLLSMWLLARYPPNPDYLLNAEAATAYFRLWHGPASWGGSLLGCLMILNLLLVVYIWACLRGLPRGAFADRVLQILAYGGSAVLLMALQRALLGVSLLQPAYRAIPLPLTPFP